MYCVLFHRCFWRKAIKVMSSTKKKMFSVPLVTCAVTQTTGTLTHNKYLPSLNLPTPGWCCLRSTYALDTQVQQTYYILHRKRSVPLHRARQFMEWKSMSKDQHRNISDWIGNRFSNLFPLYSYFEMRVRLARTMITKLHHFKVSGNLYESIYINRAPLDHESVNLARKTTSAWLTGWIPCSDIDVKVKLLNHIHFLQIL